MKGREKQKQKTILYKVLSKLSYLIVYLNNAQERNKKNNVIQIVM